MSATVAPSCTSRWEPSGSCTCMCSSLKNQKGRLLGPVGLSLLQTDHHRRGGAPSGVRVVKGVVVLIRKRSISGRRIHRGSKRFGAGTVLVRLVADFAVSACRANVDFRAPNLLKKKGLPDGMPLSNASSAISSDSDRSRFFVKGRADVLAMSNETTSRTALFTSDA